MRLLVLPALFPSERQPVAGIFILRQLQALQRLGVEAQVLTIVPRAPRISKKWRTYASIPPEYTWEGVPCKTIRALVPPRMLGLELVRRQIEPRLRHEIDMFRPDVIHVHFLIPTGFMTISLTNPVVLTAHGGDAHTFPWRRRDLKIAARKALSSATKVAAVSDYIRSMVQRLGRDDARIIYNGADETVFAPASREQARRQLGLDQTRPIILFAGHLLRAKGVFDLIAAIVRLRDINPLLILAGEGAHRRHLESACARANLDCLFLGNVIHSHLAQLYAAADAVTLPSHMEGLPAVVCEAMLSGRAVIATPVGGIPEIIQHGESGMLVPAQDSPALADTLRVVVTDRHLRDRLERGARAFALNNLTWAINARSYLGLYAEAIEAAQCDPNLEA